MRQSAKGRKAAELKGLWSRLPSLFIRLCEYWPSRCTAVFVPSACCFPITLALFGGEDLELDRAQRGILTAVVLEAAVSAVKISKQQNL